MRKILTTLSIMMLILSFSMIGLAVPSEIPANLEVQPNGASQPPIIKCKWEFAVDAANGMDCDPTVPYTQVDPPMTYQDHSQVDFFVIVTDPDNPFEARDGQVEVDLYHPTNNGLDNIYEPGDGSFKANIILTLMDSNEAINIINSIVDNSLEDLIWFNDGYDIAEVLDELSCNHAFCFKGTYYKYYHQPAGWYPVHVKAYDSNNVQSEIFVNYFEYTLGIGIELDFTAIDWGIVHRCEPKWFTGDWVFDPTVVDPEQPTVRNIGNWDVEIWLNFDNMGFGQSGDGITMEWDVNFDTRLGDTNGVKSNLSYEETNGVFIMPEEDVLIPVDNSVETGDTYRNDVLLKCHTAKIGFMIHVLKATLGDVSYGGPVTITAQCPSYVPDDMPTATDV